MGAMSLLWAILQVTYSPEPTADVLKFISMHVQSACVVCLIGQYIMMSKCNPLKCFGANYEDPDGWERRKPIGDQSRKAAGPRRVRPLHDNRKFRR